MFFPGNNTNILYRDLQFLQVVFVYGEIIYILFNMLPDVNCTLWPFSHVTMSITLLLSSRHPAIWIWQIAYWLAIWIPSALRSNTAMNIPMGHVCPCVQCLSLDSLLEGEVRGPGVHSSALSHDAFLVQEPLSLQAHLSCRISILKSLPAC